MRQPHALALDGLHQIEQPLQCGEVRRAVGDLRADVAVDADDLDARQARGLPVHSHRALVGDAELVAAQPGGDVGMGLGVDVRIDAQADRRALAGCRGQLRQRQQLRFALDVEASHADGQRERATRRSSCRRPRTPRATGRRRWPARAAARRPTRCRSRSLPPRRSAGPPGWSWPSSRSRSDAGGPTGPSGRAPARRASRRANTRTAACRAPRRGRPDARPRATARCRGGAGTARPAAASSCGR